MLNVQTLGILLRALRDGNARPDALRAPGAVGGVVRVTPVASDPNESLRGDAGVRALPVLRPLLRDGDDQAQMPVPRAGQPGVDARASPREANVVDPRIATSEPLLSDTREAPEPGRADVQGAPRQALHGDTRVASRTALQGALTATAPRSADVNNVSTALALSATSRWLAGVQNHVETANPSPAHAPAAPLITEPSAPPTALATALEQSVQASGLFYEAHLARWIADDLPLSAIMREPQAAWPTTANPEQPAVASLPQQADQLAVVARQLATLDTKAIVWTGTPWPQQQATIEIREDEHAPHGDSLERERAAPAWRTRIALTLPSLGTVDAVLALRGTTLDVVLVASEPAQRNLTAGRHDLAAALAARSLELTGFSVRDHDGD